MRRQKKTIFNHILMKKIFYVVLGVVLTLGAVALTSSCKKDIDNAESLVGSLWTCQDDGDVYELTFPSSSEFKIIRTGDNRVVKGIFIITGNKTSLTGSYITFSPYDEWMDGDDDSITGKFESESKLVINSEDMTFTRSLQ